MINKLYYSTNLFKAFTFEHLLMVIFVLLTVFSIKHLFENGYKDENKNLKKLIIITVLIQQFSLYSWYYMNGHFDLKSSLPLYPCRIWTLTSLLYILTDNEELFSISYLLGIPSGIIAFLIPDTDTLGFPNLMFIQFIIGHLMLIIMPMYGYYVNKRNVDFKTLITAFATILLYSIVVTKVNSLLGSNYGYLNAPPFESQFIIKIGKFYEPLFILFMMICTSIWYKIATRNRIEI